MPFNISEFKAHLNAHGGPARSAHYIVRITPPPGVIYNSGMTSHDLSFFCDSAQLPGVSLGTDNVKHAGYGVQEARPYSVLFEPFSCTFIGDSQGKILQYFHNWMKFINNWPIDNTGSSVTSKMRDTFSYPSDYYTRLQVITYDNTGQEVKQYTLENTYPLTVGSIDVNWNNMDAFVSIPMTFQYHSWNVDSFSLDEIGQGSGSSVAASLAPFIPYIFNINQLEQIVNRNDITSSVLYNLLLR